MRRAGRQAAEQKAKVAHTTTRLTRTADGVVATEGLTEVRLRLGLGVRLTLTLT